MPRTAAAKPRQTVALEPDLKQALRRVLELMAIPGTSGREGQVRDYIAKSLRKAGAPARAIVEDDAHRKTPFDGESGNLVLALPGTVAGPRRLLMAHMDTVPLCVGTVPELRGRVVRSANKATGLGADDRAGCAVVLTAAVEVLQRRLPHPPLTFLWLVQEEVGLYGAHFANLKLLGKPKLAFNWDGGPAEKLTVGATGAYRLTIDVQGLASHAGGAPEQGISAITIAGLAIAELHAGGWLGDVRQGSQRGTSNIGVIQGGAATNVVTDHVQLRAEARSHDAEFRRRILGEIEQAFQAAAARVKNIAGATGSAKVASRLDYDAFQLPRDEPCVLAAEAAVRAIGGEPLRAVSNGGLDANWTTARGIPTVTLGCGQVNVHTTGETLDVAAYERACRIGLRLATG